MIVEEFSVDINVAREFSPGQEIEIGLNGRSRTHAIVSIHFFKDHATVHVKALNTTRTDVVAGLDRIAKESAARLARINSAPTKETIRAVGDKRIPNPKLGPPPRPPMMA